METTLSNLPGAWDEIAQLISLLNDWGVTYLVGLEHSGTSTQSHIERLSPVELIQRLAQCAEFPRVRDASIALFLLHPELADTISEVLQTSTPEIAEQVAILTLATLYLQRLWSIRLTLALGQAPLFPEQRFAFLWQNRHMPPPDCRNGKWGLMALQEAEQRRTGLPLSFLGDWQNQIDHLLRQEEAKQQQISTPIALPKDEEHSEQECDTSMSMQPNVDKSAIESFLQHLGRTFRKSGRLSLVEGAALVHAGVRPGFTQDIDIQVSGANEGELIVTIQRLIQQLQVNVEFASPGDFIPLPLNGKHMHNMLVAMEGWMSSISISTALP